MHPKEAEEEEEEDGEVVLEAAQTDGSDLLKGDTNLLSLAQSQQQRKMYGKAFHRKYYINCDSTKTISVS